MNSLTLRKVNDRLATVLAIAAALLAVIPLAAMIGYVLAQGGSALSWAFFTQNPAPAGEPGGGMLSQIVGTLLLIALTSLIGIPIGILGGMYLARGGRFAYTVRFITDVIAGTPSIVAGIVAYALVVIPSGHFSAWAGSVALAILMFPTVTRAAEEALRLVPEPIREAGLALGLPNWKTSLLIVLPAAANGIVTAIMLGIARVAGETAPLVFTALGNDNLSYSANQPIGALPLEIWKFATAPYQTWQQHAWAGAFVLFALILGINLTARVLTFRLARNVGAI